MNGTVGGLVKRVRRRAEHAWRSTKTSVLTGGGERVDIDLTRRVREDRLDIYELSHLHRYRFAVSQIAAGATVADLACGTGYGSAMLAEECATVFGADIDFSALHAARARYQALGNVSFRCMDLLQFDAENAYDAIVSFETLEHFAEADLLKVLDAFRRALKPHGRLIFSTPYLQENSEAAKALGFHRTFLIDESNIDRWLNSTGYRPISYLYQNYSHHQVVPHLGTRDFVICIAERR